MLKKYDMSNLEASTVTAGIVKSVSSEETSQSASIPADVTNEFIVFKKAQSKKEKSAITSFFKTNNITITEKRVDSDDAIMYLVNSIADCLPIGEDFLHILRKAICNKDGHFEYNLGKQNDDKREAVIKIANIMKSCGVFSQMVISTWNITGNLSSAARVKRFLSGGWLELYSQHVVVNVVKKYAEEHNLLYEVYFNLKVEGEDNVKHEIDLMFSLGDDKVFGAEIKSGLNFCDYDRYRLIAEWMHLIPDRFLLFNSTLTDENAAKCISYFYQYFICGISTFENTIIQMLNKAVNG